MERWLVVNDFYGIAHLRYWGVRRFDGAGVANCGAGDAVALLKSFVSVLDRISVKSFRDAQPDLMNVYVKAATYLFQLGAWGKKD